MIAAIYARKSTEQHGVAEEQKSVTRQLDHGRRYATEKGWTVDEAQVYVDDGISGAEFATRPGFLRLMNALKPRPPFQVLVMSEESRLGREAIETAYALKQIVTAGVRVFFYLENRERTLDSPTDKIMLSLTAFADELEREKARQRVSDAMIRKARAGHVTGGRVFGYDNVEVRDAAGNRSHVDRCINEPEAAVVRDIFERCVQGQGFRTIAYALNALGALSPRAQQGRPAGWCPSSVREVLHRPLYRGEIVWNRTRKRNAWGVKQTQDRPAADWLTIPAPALRIVSDDVWTAARTRLAGSRATYLHATGGATWGTPTNGVESKYLLTGLAQCGVCGGGLYVTTRSHGRQRAYFYACATRHRKGHTACSNHQLARMADADEIVLEAMEQDLLDPVVVTGAIRKASATLVQVPDDLDSRCTALRARLLTLKGEIARLTDALAAGGSLDALVAGVTRREQERRDVAHALRELEERYRPGGETADQIGRDLVARVSEWRACARRTVADGRQILRHLLRGRVRFTPSAVEDGRIVLVGQTTYSALFRGIVLATAMASLTGNDCCDGPDFRRVLRAA